MSTLTAPTPLRRVRAPRAILALVAAAAIAAGSHAATLLTVPDPALDARPSAPAVSGPVDALAGFPAGSLEQINHSIGAWTANLAANELDFISATNLGLLYDARGRITGDVGDYLRAQTALERALDVVPDHMPARLLHARLLQTTHDFAGARDEAIAILRDDPTQVQATATLGDAQLELGEVEAAAATFASLASAAPGAPVTARLSRLAFIQGDTAAAVQLAVDAFEEARAAGEPGPALGWYAYLVGVSNISTGDPTAALGWFDRAATSWPGGFLALAGQARAAAALGRPDDAIRLYEQAIAIAPQPDLVAALGDLYALRGDDRRAADQYATVVAIAHLAALNEQVYNRQLVLFSVDHDRDLAEALVLARTELEVRRDVYGYDAYAWALLANGHAEEADEAMRQALAFGTKDAMLDYHAGMIALALGDEVAAHDLLAAALAVDGGLDPLSASRARAAVEAVR